MDNVNEKLHVFELIVENAKDVDSHTFRHEKIGPLLKSSGIPYTMEKWEWLGPYKTSRDRVRILISTNSEKEGQDLRRILREDPDIWFYRDGSVYHCAPISRKPVPIKYDDELFYLLVKTAKEANIHKNVATIAYNRLVINRLIDSWKTIDSEKLLSIKGLGTKAVELILLARGEDPYIIEKEDYKDPDISAAMEETLFWEDDRFEFFIKLRNKVLKYSRHPECVDILVDFAFNLGCEYTAKM